MAKVKADPTQTKEKSVHIVEPCPGKEAVEEEDEEEEEEKKEKHPRKHGPGSKKWDKFLLIQELSITPITKVPGIASKLGNELKKRGYKTAQQLIEKYQGHQKGQHGGDDAKFRTWFRISCGGRNTQYGETVLAAIKAYVSKTVPTPLALPVTPKTEPTEDNVNKGEEFAEKPIQTEKSTADAVAATQKHE